KDPATVAVKHMNPCGIGLATDLSTSFTRAYEADSISIFGRIIACNREVDAATANQMKEIFLEIVIAPSVSTAALTILQAKNNITYLTFQRNKVITFNEKLPSVKGGLLVKPTNFEKIIEVNLPVVTKLNHQKKRLKTYYLLGKQ